MKKQYSIFKPFVMLALLLGVMACDNEETVITTDDAPPAEEESTNEEGNEDEEEETDTEKIDPNLLSECLGFRNKQLKPGTIPINPSSPYYQTPGFQISQDTIFWVEGIINRVKIRKPDGFGPKVCTFFAQISGADSYIEAEFEQEKENDSIVYWDLDFCSSLNLELPASFDLDVSLKDCDTDQAIGVFNTTVVIEGSEDFDVLEVSDDESIWNWMETKLNGVYNNGPLDNFEQDLIIKGCCGGDPLTSYTVGCDTQGPDAVEIDYTNSYAIAYDYFSLDLDNNQLVGHLWENVQNLDALNVDFCSVNAPLRDDSKGNIFEAEVYDLNTAGGTFKLRNMVGGSEIVMGLEFPLPIYMGSGDLVEYRFLSPHFIKETRSGDGLVERIYHRVSTSGMANSGSGGGVGIGKLWIDITYDED